MNILLRRHLIKSQEPDIPPRDLKQCHVLTSLASSYDLYLFRGRLQGSEMEIDNQTPRIYYFMTSAMRVRIPHRDLKWEILDYD